MPKLHPARFTGAVAAAFVPFIAMAVLTPLCATAAPASATSSAAPSSPAPSPGSDPRIREIRYDPNAVVTLPVKRGVVTHLILGSDEAITDVATGIGADCTKPEASWCIAAQPGAHQLFIKPKSTATATNTLAVATDKRVHTLRLVLLPDGDRREPLYRLQILPPKTSATAAHLTTSQPSPLSGALLPPQTLPELTPIAELDEGTGAAEPHASLHNEARIKDRLSAAPGVVNDRYSLSEGKASQDIVPTVVFDDGRFTYLRFPNNREVPAVFHVQPDGTETVVNARMEGDLLAIDRVSRHLVLRAGSAVVGIWNDAFDLDGRPPVDGTAVPGVRRSVRPPQALAAPEGATP